ncbi:type I-E CRISPR-associated protein Cas6/Cse3/CasE [Streptomyces sp. NBC_01803]|uniref:type I-E CRISPR-associated protein Cas6/Cse3/CasE n=1 Tax=Streptomyces sp. NBC_01803 TaxID=2975946 RepID=UPI002DD9F56D|nr:type I-E CRISPR-associated protein Cas6/Cse3/CasE [Streptomyces sp. NBC_01803]WSA46455.1 type I-E CRISPR-associated protein Cas6/Cse3/CasE [Streptomyces sp. NBC_01803]
MSTPLWITRLVPDPRNATARKDLNSAVALHHRIMAFFPDGLGDRARQQAGVLFRIEESPGRETTILIQSGLRPVPERLPETYGAAQTKPLDPLLDQLRTGDRVHYRLVANATRKLGRNTQDGCPHQVKPLYGADADAWWERQAARAGLDILSVRSMSLSDATGRRVDGAHRITHARTRFDGIASITDAGALRTAIVHGIGRGKSYGCGLLSTIPVR